MILPLLIAAAIVASLNAIVTFMMDNNDATKPYEDNLFCTEFKKYQLRNARTDNRFKRFIDRYVSANIKKY